MAFVIKIKISDSLDLSYSPVLTYISFYLIKGWGVSTRTLETPKVGLFGVLFMVIGPSNDDFFVHGLYQGFLGVIRCS